MVKIDFSFPSQYGTFADAIWLPDDHKFSPADIEAMKLERFTQWQSVIESASQQPPVVEGDLAEQQVSPE